MPHVLLPRTPAEPVERTRRALRTSTLDGVFAVQYVTLTGGTLLSTFLLALGASAQQIGVVAALPLLGALLQPAGAEIIRRRGGRRKGLCLSAAAIEVALWSASVAAVVWLPPAQAVAAVIGVLALQQAATAFVGVAWTSWISDLVPPRMRGRYFGYRNLACNALGAATAAAAGLALRQTGNAVETFLALIVVGVACRLVSLGFLMRQPESRPAQSSSGGLLRQLRLPLAHRAFRRYLGQQAAWGFAVNLASPFFAVYMVTEAGLGADAVLAFAALGTLANLAGQRVWGHLCDHYGDQQVLRVSAFWAAIMPALWMFTGPGAFGVVLMALLTASGGFLWSGVTLATGNLTMRLAPETGKTSFFAAHAAWGGAGGAAGALAGGAVGVALSFAWLPGLKALFAVSALLRLGAWAALRLVPAPASDRSLRTVLVLRDTVRTLNPAQGFSPLLHSFVSTARTVRRRARHTPHGQKG